MYDVYKDEIETGCVYKYIGTKEYKGVKLKTFEYDGYVTENGFLYDKYYFYVEDDIINGDLRGKKIKRFCNNSFSDLKVGDLFGMSNNLYHDSHEYLNANCKKGNIMEIQAYINFIRSGFYGFDEKRQQLIRYDCPFKDVTIFNNIKMNQSAALILHFEGPDFYKGKHIRLFSINEYLLGSECNDYFNTKIRTYKIDRSLDCTKYERVLNDYAFVSSYFKDAQKACEIEKFDPYTIDEANVKEYMLKKMGGNYISEGYGHFRKVK